MATNILRVAFLVRDGRETSEDGCCLADLRQEFGFRQVADIVGHFKSAKDSCAISMHASLRLLLAIECLLLLNLKSVM